MSIKDRILAFLKKQGIPKEEFYRATELSASNFKGIALKSELGGEKIVKILTAYRSISPEWLLMGEGTMLRDNKISEENTMETTPNVIPISPADESIIYKMYKEKDLEVKDLMEAVGSLKEQIRQLKRENERLASDATDSIRANVG